MIDNGLKNGGVTAQEKCKQQAAMRLCIKCKAVTA